MKKTKNKKQTKQSEPVHRAAMAAVWKHTIQGDPRREDLIQPYKRVPVKEEDQDPDFRALASLGLGMAGLFTKVTHRSPHLTILYALACTPSRSRSFSPPR